MTASEYFFKKMLVLWYEINIKSSISWKFEVDEPRGYRITKWRHQGEADLVSRYFCNSSLKSHDLLFTNLRHLYLLRSSVDGKPKINLTLLWSSSIRSWKQDELPNHTSFCTYLKGPAKVCWWTRKKKVFIVPLKEMKGTLQKLLVFGWWPLLVQDRK